MSTIFFGKPRTRLGRFIDKHGITQSSLEDWTKGKVNKSMISKMCSNKEYNPTTDKVNIILKVLRKRVDENIDYDDFWM